MTTTKTLRAPCVALIVAAVALIAAASALGAPKPAWAPVGASGPTNLPPKTSEIQRVKVDATGGQFTLTFPSGGGGQTTAPIDFDAEPAEVAAKLNELSTIGGVGAGVEVSGGPGDAGATQPYFVRFAGALAGTNVSQMESSPSLLAGGASTASVDTQTQGGTPGTGTVALYMQNVGGASSVGQIKVETTLPAGLVASGPSGNGWACTTSGGGSSFACTSNATVSVGGTPEPILAQVTAIGAAEGTETIHFTVSGGTADSVDYDLPLRISSTPAKPGFQSFIAGAYDEEGNRDHRAGGHPYAASTGIFVNTVLSPLGKIVPAGDFKNIDVDLPPGFLGDPIAVPQCPESALQCPADTIVGRALPILQEFGHATSNPPVFNIQAPYGYPAKFRFSILETTINVVGSLRSDGDYGLTAGSVNTPPILPVFGTFFTFFGTPANFNGGGGAATPFLTSPTDCAEEALNPPVTTLSVNTWQQPEAFSSTSVSLPPVTECDQLSFHPGFTFQPEKTSAATPSAFTAELTVPQEGLTDPDKRAEPALKKAVVTLPKGVVVNPSSADGLATCTTQQIGLEGTSFPAPNPIRFTKESPSCPDASKIGTVEVDTALLENPLPGTLYLAAQDENPFHSTLAVYLVVDDPSVGIIIKLPGEVRADPATGQLVATFDDNPQLPFNSLRLNFKGGERAPLATPDTCGTATTTTELTPWSAPESGAPATTENEFDIDSGPGGSACVDSKAERPFHPTFEAGTTPTTAGGYGPLTIKLTRNDGEQELKRLDLTFPPGLSGKLAGIASCSEAQIEAAQAASGRAEQASPSCPASSQIGTVSTGAGIGGDPIYVPGKVYLAGPYEGAPISTVVITPAVAGPFDLGNVVIRSPLYVNPQTAQLHTVTDEIPDILDGIPLQLRSVTVNVDRQDFTLNPTSCEKFALDASLTGAGGDTTTTADDTLEKVSVPFQVGGCSDLAFSPKLALSLKGGTKRNDHPALTATLTQPAGQANIGRVAVALPHSEFLDQSHIRTVCTRVQFSANSCPQGSVYGRATAVTPLLDQPLSGPVYLRSSDNRLPDMVAALRGPDTQPIEVDLDGRVDSIHGGIRNTFEVIPDAPVSKFTLSLQGGRKGLLVNSRNLCSATNRATVRIIGQNNKRADQFPKLQSSCGKKRRSHRDRALPGRLPRGW